MPHGHRQADEMSPFIFALLAACGVMFLYYFGQLIVISVVKDEESFLFPFLLGWAQILLILVPTLILSRYQSIRQSELFRLRGSLAPTDFFTALLGVVALWMLSQVYLVVQDLYLISDAFRERYDMLAERLESIYKVLFSSESIGGLLAAWGIGALIPGICEELLFRGLIQRSFERQLTPRAAFILAGILFGLVHLNPILLVPLVLLGIYLGFTVWVTDSIYPAIAGHLVINTLAILNLNTGIQHVAEAEGITTLATGELLLILSIALPLLVLSVFVLNRRRQKRIEADSIE